MRSIISLSSSSRVLKTVQSVVKHLPRRWRRFIRSLPLPSLSHDPKRILECDIQMITVEADEFADRIRTKPENKLHCTGGTAFHLRQLYPKQMQCINVGVDANGKVNWICKANHLDHSVEIRHACVSFEGWSGPGDPYVRAGSEVVKYELFKTVFADKLNDSDNDNSTIGYVLVILFILSIVVFASMSKQSVFAPVVVQTRPQVVKPSYIPPVIFSESGYIEHPFVVIKQPPIVVVKPVPVVQRVIHQSSPPSYEYDSLPPPSYEYSPEPVSQSRPAIAFAKNTDSE